MILKSKLLNPSEAMHTLGISYSTLLRQVKGGTIPHVKIGKALRFPSSYFIELEQMAVDNMGGSFEK